MIFNLKHDWQAASSDDNVLLLRKYLGHLCEIWVVDYLQPLRT